MSVYVTFNESIKWTQKEIVIVKQILERLAYFDIFNHVLTLDELIKFSKVKDHRYHWRNVMDRLVSDGIVFRKEAFFSINPKVGELADFRAVNEKNAQHFFAKLPFFVNLIKHFPFVRSIAISGSLSKGVIHGDGDVDYFIITAPGGLWISRMMLILFKKIFLFNSKKYFCINYLVDTDNLTIPDQNLFTATEIAFLFPVYNEELFSQFKESNSWVEDFYPDFRHIENVEAVNKGSQLRDVLERLIFKKEFFNKWFMNITIRHWKKKFGHVRPKTFELTLRSNPGVSKHHPRNFQQVVLSAYDKRLKSLEIK